MSDKNSIMQIEINIFKLLNSPFAVSTEEGELLFSKIEDAFSKEYQVTLDFDNIEIIVSTFLNASIGQLYGKFTTEYIQNNLSLKNMSDDDLDILKLVTDRAKEYFQDKNRFDNISNSFFANEK